MRGQVSVVVRAHSGERARTDSARARRSPNRSRAPWPSWAWGSRPPSAWRSGSGSGSGWTALVHTAPAFLLVGLALGLAVAALSVIKQIRTYL